MEVSKKIGQGGQEINQEKCFASVLDPLDILIDPTAQKTNRAIIISAQNFEIFEIQNEHLFAWKFARHFGSMTEIPQNKFGYLHNFFIHRE